MQAQIIDSSRVRKNEREPTEANGTTQQTGANGTVQRTVVLEWPSNLETVNREVPLSTSKYPQFEYCVEWIYNNPKFLKKKDPFGKKRNTAALKGLVEQWLRAEDVSDHYIPQGAFIIAALSEGYVIDEIIKGCPNVYLKKK